jgi:putative membrane protein
MTRTIALGVLATALACHLAGNALAQQQFAPGQAAPANQPANQRATSGDASQEVNRFLASCWAAKNQAEIEISQLAQQQANNAEVKQFAQKMVEEHRQLQQKLQPLAAQGASSNANSPIGRLISIEKQIVDRGTEQMRQKLDEKSGAEFDKCYLGGQVACHMQAAAALSVVSQEASGELKELARTAKQTIDQHLQKAEQLLEQQSKSSQQAGATRDPNLRPASAQR